MLSVEAVAVVEVAVVHGVEAAVVVKMVARMVRAEAADRVSKAKRVNRPAEGAQSTLIYPQVNGRVVIYITVGAVLHISVLSQRHVLGGTSSLPSLLKIKTNEGQASPEI